MRDLEALDGEVEELDCSGLCAVPGLVDCHTHPAFGGDRVGEFSLRAGGASYEELHAAGGGILSTVAATRALAPAALLERVERHAAWMLAHGTTTWEGKSGYGLDRDTELASLRGGSRRRRLADVARRARRAARASPTPTRTSTTSSPTCSPRRRVSPTRPTSSSSAARSTPPQARRYLEACRGGRARAPPPRRPVHRERRGAARDRPRRPEHRPPRGDRRRRASRRSATATSWPCCFLQARSSSIGRCLRRARSSTPAPPSRSRPTSTRELVHDEPAADRVARLHAAAPRSRGGARRDDGQRGACRSARPTAAGSPRACAPT